MKNYISVFFMAAALVMLSLGACGKKQTPSASKQGKSYDGQVVAQNTATSTVTDVKATGEQDSQSAASGVITKGNLTVMEAVVCRSIENLNPIEPSDTFASDIGRVFFFTRIGVVEGDEDNVTHVWHHKDNPVASVQLSAKGKQWRTYSSKAISPAHRGNWRVDVVNSNSEVVVSRSFTVE